MFFRFLTLHIPVETKVQFDKKRKKETIVRRTLIESAAGNESSVGVINDEGFIDVVSWPFDDGAEAIDGRTFRAVFPGARLDSHLAFEFRRELVEPVDSADVDQGAVFVHDEMLQTVAAIAGRRFAKCGNDRTGRRCQTTTTTTSGARQEQKEEERPDGLQSRRRFRLFCHDALQ